jgi:hypothetical protein
MKILEAETLSNICADPEGLGCRRPVGQFRSDSVLRGGNSQLFAASLTIVHVYEPVSLCEYASETSNTVLEEQRDDLQKMLKQLTRKLQTSSLICTSAFLVGAPAEQISALAREIDADLIVTVRRFVGAFPTWTRRV